MTSFPPDRTASRVRAVFQLPALSFNAWLGRTAHLNTIDDEAFVAKLAVGLLDRFV